MHPSLDLDHHFLILLGTESFVPKHFKSDLYSFLDICERYKVHLFICFTPRDQSRLDVIQWCKTRKALYVRAFSLLGWWFCLHCLFLPGLATILEMFHSISPIESGNGAMTSWWFVVTRQRSQATNQSTSHFFDGNFNHQLTKHIHHCLRFGWAEKARKAFSEVRMLKGL